MICAEIIKWVGALDAGVKVVFPVLPAVPVVVTPVVYAVPEACVPFAVSEKNKWIILHW